MIEHIKCDIFESGADAILHQVNCQGVMGSGIAKQVKEKLTSSDSLVVDGNNIWLGDKASIQQKRNQPTPNKVKENQPEVDLPEEISNQDIEQYLRDNPQIIANYLAEQQQATQKANEMKQ